MTHSFTMQYRDPKADDYTRDNAISEAFQIIKHLCNTDDLKQAILTGKAQTVDVLRHNAQRSVARLRNAMLSNDKGMLLTEAEIVADVLLAFPQDAVTRMEQEMIRTNKSGGNLFGWVEYAPMMTGAIFLAENAQALCEAVWANEKEITLILKERYTASLFSHAVASLLYPQEA